MRPIYLDYNASTPIAPEVVAAMRPFLDGAYGNPSSGHWAGNPAREAVERARGHIAHMLGCASNEVVFTSGGSESNNHALKGVTFALRDKGDHIVTSTVEHPATLVPCEHLARLGYKITHVPVDGLGRVAPDDVRRALTPRTILVSIMHANNEVGTIQPIEDIGRITRERGIVLHTDAAQAVGKILTKVDELGVDLLSIAGHKLHAPKGVGALYIRNGTPIEPLIHGGGHEGGRRAGTESALMTAALGAAAELAANLPPMRRIRDLRDDFWRQLKAALGDRVVLNGHPQHRLPNTLNVSFVGRIGADVLASLDGVAASTGSACHSGRVELSPVLRAMGTSPQIGMGAVRFSLGRETTTEEIDTVVAMINQTLGAPGR
ncbi:MAG TPA: cysteine desulfurase family protein [Steroidobacteraceae bacterium]|nr:cysteine desulfurase family protein [Steroidobacteraceae bacterium]